MKKASPEIRTLSEKNLVGHSMKMSLATDTTGQLWGGFMPNRKNVSNAIGNDLYSLQVYDDGLDVEGFTPNTIFEKWATVEVSSFDEVPEGMKTFTLVGGLYAVFLFKGLPQDFPKLLEYAYTEWLPASDYQLDKRPHFEILGEKYKNNHPDSEEEVWIPIMKK